MYAKNKNGKIKTAIAVNEVSVFRETRQAAKLEIKVDNKIRMKEIVCDGTLVATPAGRLDSKSSTGPRADKL